MSSEGSVEAEHLNGSEESAAQQEGQQHQQQQQQGLDENGGGVRNSSTRKLEALEIDEEGITEDELELDNTIDEDDNDLEELLPADTDGGVIQNSNKPSSSTSLRSKTSSAPLVLLSQRLCRSCLGEQDPPVRVGNMIIVFPRLFRRTGLGILGPHWFGPLCILLLLMFATTFFVTQSLQHIGPGTALICVGFTIMTAYNLFHAAFRDPGVVLLQQNNTTAAAAASNNDNNSEIGADHRWCDLCQCYQPPNGAHCPDCNVCIAGFDHHCVWMGTCIGRSNFKQFLRFNLSWLLYLIYAIVWVSVLGPIVSHHHGHGGDGAGAGGGATGES